MSSSNGKLHYKKGRELYGSIKANQVWRKRDTGRYMRIWGKGKNGTTKVQFFDPISGENQDTHSIKERDIYMFYERVS